MSKTDESLDKYMEDISHIRSLLEQNQERPVIRPWAFYAWGLIVIAAALVSWYLVRSLGIDGRTVFLTVGIPGMAIGGLAEIKALTAQMRTESMPVFSTRMNRYYASFLGILIPMLFFIYFLIDTGAPMAGLLLMASTLPVFMYGLMSFSCLFFNGYTILVIGFVMLFIDVPDRTVLNVTAGIIIGISYIAAGIQSRREGKRFHG